MLTFAKSWCRLFASCISLLIMLEILGELSCAQYHISLFSRSLEANIKLNAKICSCCLFGNELKKMFHVTRDRGLTPSLS